jgi:hypothetical protein
MQAVQQLAQIGGGRRGRPGGLRWPGTAARRGAGSRPWTVARKNAISSLVIGVLSNTVRARALRRAAAAALRPRSFGSFERAFGVEGRGPEALRVFGGGRRVGAGGVFCPPVLRRILRPAWLRRRETFDRPPLQLTKQHVTAGQNVEAGRRLSIEAVQFGKQRVGLLALGVAACSSEVGGAAPARQAVEESPRVLQLLAARE